MKLNEFNFYKIFNNINKFEPNAKIAVGVSGGVDSLVLSFLLNKISRRKKIKIISLIVDHKIRKNSSKEAKDVSLYLSSIGISNNILVLKKDYKSTGIQKTARLKRLNILRNYCYKNNIMHLFLGHHYDDNIETFLIRKLAGSSIEGLNSIKNLSIFKDIEIIRPLISFNKKEIINFAIKNNLSWIEDPSNTNNIFSRSRIRKIISKTSDRKKNKIYNNYKNINYLYNDYVEMINSCLVNSIVLAEYKKIELDRKYYLSLPNEIAIKIIEICAKYVHEQKLFFKHSKLLNVYFQITKKTIKIRSQNTIFISSSDKIVIYSAK